VSAESTSNDRVKEHQVHAMRDRESLDDGRNRLHFRHAFSAQGAFDHCRPRCVCDDLQVDEFPLNPKPTWPGEEANAVAVIDR
jgi:hypothetical protein